MAADRRERDRVVNADQDIVHLMLDRATSKLTDLAEQPHDLCHAGIVTGERASARKMPEDVRREELIGHGAQVAAAECRARRLQ